MKKTKYTGAILGILMFLQIQIDQAFNTQLSDEITCEEIMQPEVTGETHAAKDEANEIIQKMRASVDLNDLDELETLADKFVSFGDPLLKELVKTDYTKISVEQAKEFNETFTKFLDGFKLLINGITVGENSSGFEIKMMAFFHDVINHLEAYNMHMAALSGDEREGFLAFFKGTYQDDGDDFDALEMSSNTLEEGWS